DLEAAQVCDVLAQREPPVHVGRAVHHRVGIELLHHQPGARLEALRVVGRPPVTQVTNGVELTALVVEPVRHLVTDDGAHTTVVHRVVGRRVEKGGLENARGKGDVVEGRV